MGRPGDGEHVRGCSPRSANVPVTRSRSSGVPVASGWMMLAVAVDIDREPRITSVRTCAGPGSAADRKKALTHSGSGCPCIWFNRAPLKETGPAVAGWCWSLAVLRTLAAGRRRTRATSAASPRLLGLLTCRGCSPHLTPAGLCRRPLSAGGPRTLRRRPGRLPPSAQTTGFTQRGSALPPRRWCSTLRWQCLAMTVNLWSPRALR